MKKVSLDDKYVAQEGRVYLSGPQALTRLPMMQISRDRRAGLNTAGFISGYRGSPLGVYDMALWQADKFLKDHNIHFQPGVNEDLAATAVWGSQLVEVRAETDYDGVIGMWYGKGPGVDRSGDALKHGGYAGASAHGGVLVLCGDDHAGRSSTLAHQSDQAFIHFDMPILNPASVQDYLDLGLLGFALSRYSGCWVGFKCITDTVDGSASVCVDPERVSIVQPTDYQLPDEGLNLRIGLWPLAAEELALQRLEAVKAFARANHIDKAFYAGGRKRLGIVSSGKAWLDVMEALSQLGIDEAEAGRLGIAVYKVGMVWPLEPQRMTQFASACDVVLVVEEKRPVIEGQLASLLYGQPSEARPILIGKHDQAGGDLVSAKGELNPMAVAKIIAAQRLAHSPDPQLTARLEQLEQAETGCALTADRDLVRMQSFCAGCPHNTSTKVPEGSIGRPGIGCHGMVQFVAGRRTEKNLTHMGAEGATWIGEAPFTNRPHIFQNIGDGTYFHSGLMAVRANVAAGTNITYKILVNGAIAMTGGQLIEGEIFDGGITAPHVAHQVHAEGVRRIALVTEDLDRHNRHEYPGITTFHHRDELEAVQKEIREHPGTSVLIYEQACATERRRLRKRGAYPDLDKRLFINEEVCEGCGDCGVQSNCIALEPNETKFGRKRKINQSVCNKDFSCVQGMCPSFVTVYGGRLRAADAKSGFDDGLFAHLPEPEQKPGPGAAPEIYNIVVAGIGGGGIVTLGALLGMAAHMEERPCSVLDVTGAAQRNGPVTSHIRIGAGGELQNTSRIPQQSVDLVLAADMVVASGQDVLPMMSSERTAAIYNSYVAPTSDFAQNADLSFSTEGMESQISQRCRDGAAHGVSATQIATQILGNAIGANLFLLGVAWQRGLIPLSRVALERAIELNGTAVAMNKRAFQLGRLCVADRAALDALMSGREAKETTPPIDDLEALILNRRQWLTDYQSAAYADHYEALVRKVAETEQRIIGKQGDLTEAVARYYAKLMAYKDEYEVARLMTRKEFFAQLDKTFEGDYHLQFNLAPPLLSRRDPQTGRYAKMEFGAWILKAFKVLAPLKILRGTAFDVFGYSAHRRYERQMILDYEQTISDLLGTLSVENFPTALKLAQLPESVRGYDVVKEESIEDMKIRRAALRHDMQNNPVERSDNKVEA